MGHYQFWDSPPMPTMCFNGKIHYCIRNNTAKPVGQYLYGIDKILPKLTIPLGIFNYVDIEETNDGYEIRIHKPS